MSLTALTTTELVAIIASVVIVVAGIAVLLFVRKRRSERLRNRFGAEYDRTVKEEGNQRHAEAQLEKRAERVESFHVRPLASPDRARFVDAWRGIQARFVDDPAGTVVQADQLLGDVMSTRGYPVTDFEQRAADISVDHPVVLENYRAGHEIALRQAEGKANTEDLRQAMIHYRALFEELAGVPKKPDMKVAS